MAKVLITGASKGIGREAALVLARAGHTVVAAMRRPAESDLAAIAAREKLPITVAELDVDGDASVARLFGSDAAKPESIDVLVNNAGIYSINAVEGMSEALAQEMGAFGVRVAVVEPGIIATPMTIQNLPKVKEGTAYPHGGRMRAFYAPTAVSGPPPSIVADAILDIVEGKITGFRTPSGPDARPFLDLRASQTDEQWIALSDTLDDDVYFDRFQAISGLDLRPPKG
jgi:NAD(P)-dependent dehydrogenase (short-subunit alcohol dehydrogenase family)